MAVKMCDEQLHMFQLSIPLAITLSAKIVGFFMCYLHLN